MYASPSSLLGTAAAGAVDITSRTASSCCSNKLANPPSSAEEEAGGPEGTERGGRGFDEGPPAEVVGECLENFGDLSLNFLFGVLEN